MSEIRVVSDNEIPELIRIIGEAYPSEDITTRRQQDEAVERFRKTIQGSNWTPYGVFRDGKMVGVFRNFDFELNVRGNIVSAGGLGMVAVDLNHKKQHVAKDIVEFFLEHYHEREYPMTTLWPFRVDFYHQMGFGLGGRRYQYRLKPADLQRGPTMEHVRFLDKGDTARLDECYNRWAEKQNGALKQDEKRWQTRFDYLERQRYVGVEIDDRLEGYLIYSFQKPEHPSSFMDNDLRVPELIYHSTDALLELLAFLHTQLDQVGRVVLDTSDDEFYFLAANPTMDTGSRLAPTYHESHMAGVGIMYRVIDVRRLFDALQQPCFGDDSLTLGLNLTDSFMSANEGAHLVRFEEGRGRVIERGSADVELDIDIAEFSSLLMGSIGLEQLCTYSLASVSDETWIERLDRLFAWGQKPACITGF